MASSAGAPPGNGSNRTPRVLFGPGSTTPAKPSAAPAKAPTVLFGTPQAPAPLAGRPKVIGSGVVRIRIPCSLLDLEAMEPLAPAPVVSQALRLVEGFDLDGQHGDGAARFGNALDTEQARLTEQELALSGHQALAAAGQAVAGLAALFEALDPNQMFPARSGFIQDLVACATGLDPADAVSRLQPRIASLAGTLDAFAPELALVLDRLRATSAGYAALGTGMAAHVLAGRFIMRHIAGLDALGWDQQMRLRALGEALDQRIATLQSAQAAVEAGQRTVAALFSRAEALAVAQRGLRDGLPAWRAAYAAALAGSRSDDGAARVRFLRDVHNRLLNQLRLKE